MKRLLLLGTVLLLPQVAPAGGFTFEIGWKNRDGSFHFGIRNRRRPRRRPVAVPRRPAPVPRRVWIPGRYVEKIEYVRVPGTWRTEWVPPVVTHVRIHGCVYACVVKPGSTRRVWVPPRMVPRTRRVWVPGHWR